MKSKQVFKRDLILKCIVFVFSVLVGTPVFGQLKRIHVNHFDKVIVSPHIQINFVEGVEESVTITSNKVTDEKINIKVHNEVLRIYLEGAKIVTKSKKNKGCCGKRSIYKGTVVTATVTYKTIRELSLRGDETFVFESPMIGDKLSLKLYGELHVYFNEVDLKLLNTTMYGEGYLEIKKGHIDSHKMNCYGEGTVIADNIKNHDSKVEVYGEGNFNLNVLNRLKVTAFGEADIRYKGNPIVNKGLIIGEAIIRKN
jgi:molybdopterin-binding protein